jgi:hypothetical protein
MRLMSLIGSALDSVTDSTGSVTISCSCYLSCPSPQVVFHGTWLQQRCYCPRLDSRFCPSVGLCPIYYFKDVRAGQTVITSILEASPALMRAIVLSSLFLRVFIQLQLWHGVIFGTVLSHMKNTVKVEDAEDF